MCIFTQEEFKATDEIIEIRCGGQWKLINKENLLTLFENGRHLNPETNIPLTVNDFRKVQCLFLNESGGVNCMSKRIN